MEVHLGFRFKPPVFLVGVPKGPVQVMQASVAHTHVWGTALHRRGIKTRADRFQMRDAFNLSALFYLGGV